MGGSKGALEVGYGTLIRRNRDFRLLMAGDVVSLLGDWFNTIAIYTLVEALTGSPLALGIVFLIKTLSYALSSPLAGVIADRFNRRRLMIGADLLRAVVVLGFLLIDQTSELWLLYGLIAVQIMLGSVFRPARSASLPNVVTQKELLTANALLATTWSTILALGAALGGFATAWLGPQAVFVIDSATYLLSAWCIWQARIPQPSQAGEEAPEPLHKVAWEQVVVGWRYLLSHREVGRMALAKATWVLAGGGMVYMLALMGKILTPEDAALGIGLLLAARGIGTGIGPIAARELFRDQRRWPLVMGVCVVLSGVFYGAASRMPWTFWVMIPVVVAHAMSGANWVLSSVLLQERSEDRVRGRVFATEWLIMTLCDAASILAASLTLEHGLLDLRTALGVFAVAQIGCGLLWIATIVPAERRASS